MEFANLAALAWGLLAIPIVICYLLAVRHRRHAVSTVMFWNQVFQQRQPRSSWWRLRHVISLLVQLAFLFLLVAALLDPSLSWSRQLARRIVLVVDYSASMNATDVAPSRLAHAQALACRFVNGLRPRDRMTVIAAGSVPSVVCGWTGHQRTLNRAIKGISPSDSGTDVAAAVHLARRLLSGQDNARILVLSDGCWNETLPGDEQDVQLTRIGGRADNAGITQFQVRRSMVDATTYEVLMEVQNSSATAVDCLLELQLNQQLVDVFPLHLEAGRQWTQTVRHVAETGGTVEARLLSPAGSETGSPAAWSDALSSDDVAVALLPAAAKLRVLLVTPDPNLFLERVLQSIPLVELAVTDQLPSARPRYDLIAYHQLVPAQLPAGNVLVIDPRSSCDVWKLGATLPDAVVFAQQAEGRLMTHVRLDRADVVIPEARHLDFSEPYDALAWTADEHPIYCSLQRAQGRLLVLTANLDRGDLPLRTAFPIMMANAINWFREDPGEIREAVAAGSTVRVDLAEQPPMPVGSARPRWMLRAPNGEQRPLPVGIERLTIGPLDQVGVWRIVADRRPGDSPRDTPGRSRLELACNLASARESRLEPIQYPSLALPAGPFAAGGQPLWFYLALAALILITAEWYLYQRRWIS